VVFQSVSEIKMSYVTSDGAWTQRIKQELWA